MRDGFFALMEIDRHLQAVFLIASQRSDDFTFFFMDYPVDEGDVYSLHRVIFKLGGQLVMGIVVFGDRQEAGCILIDAMDDAGAKLAVDRAQILRVKHQGVGQGQIFVAGAGMDDEAAVDAAFVAGPLDPLLRARAAAP